MIVIDASAAVHTLLNGSPRPILDAEGLAAPHLVDAEVLHTLRRLLIGGTLSTDDAERAVRYWRRIGVLRFPMLGFIPRIWALRRNLSAYDACYAALAEALDCPLLTADARLAGAPGPTCPITLLPR